MQQIPVYVFTGFLDSGKTKFIQQTLEDPRFNAGERTLLLVFEEGEEELEEDDEEVEAEEEQEEYIEEEVEEEEGEEEEVVDEAKAVVEIKGVEES